MPKIPEKKEEDYFVGISDPIKVRKSILESSRSVIQSLHRFERFKSIRQKKIEQIHKLNSIMKEVRSLVGRLKLELPKVPVQPKKKPVKQEPEDEVIERKPQVVLVKPKQQPKVRSELERLEEELGKVEKKLADLE
jgi:hypothetical protein